MNYPAHYDRLIARARCRVLVGYRERHHVVPRCMGGGNDPENLVALTAEEHYVAHQLLVKMYPGNAKLAHAAMAMAKKCTGNKAYGWLRRRHAAALLGKPRSAEHRANTSAGLRGKKRAPFSAECRANMSAAHRGKKASTETRAKMSAWQLGQKKNWSQETRAKISTLKRGNKYFFGKKHSPEARAKISASAFSRWHDLKHPALPP